MSSESPPSSRNISYKPTEGMSYDPIEAKYWDESAMKAELERAFEVCHGCRMCFKYCDSFPILFDLIDDKYDGDVTHLTDADNKGVIDHCFQCKLCEVQCPYTPRDNHEFQLDLPKLFHRYTAIERKKRGPTLQELALRDPDVTGKAARASLGIANAANRVGAHRKMLDALIGIHPDKDLPDFAQTTFESWAFREGKTAEVPHDEHEAVLFQTCYVQNNEPDIGKDTLAVLEKNGVKTVCARGLRCCGMPAWESGDLDTLQKNAKTTLDRLEPFVEAGKKVLAINPTCSMMLRREWPELVAEEDRERAKKLAAQVMDPSEFIWSIRKEERFNTDFKSSPGPTVAYHAPCHLRAQGVGFKGKDLMKKIPGTTPTMTMECCGHDGTFAMKTTGFEESIKIGKKSFEGMQAAKAEVWATDCPLAATQFAQHAGRRPMHPMTVLARAYEEDGFPTKIPTADSDQDPT